MNTCQCDEALVAPFEGRAGMFKRHSHVLFSCKLANRPHRLFRCLFDPVLLLCNPDRGGAKRQREWLQQVWSEHVDRERRSASQGHVHCTGQRRS